MRLSPATDIQTKQLVWIDNIKGLMFTATQVQPYVDKKFRIVR
jgi:hypothetical protein